MTRIITALDYADISAAVALVERLDPSLTRLKVGNQLFTLAGPALVERFQKKGFDIFLDLKYHDIPNTVASAVAAAASLGVWMVNVHASGGARMMQAARNAVEPFSASSGTRLIGVTVLTSHEQADLVEAGVDASPEEQVRRLAALTLKAGLDGVVCSPRELALVRACAGDDFITVTPGVRPVDATVTAAAGTPDDQRRVTTPVEAVQAGAHYLVIGRPITQATDPLASLSRIHQELTNP